jgi:hypothetical protein
MFFDKARERNRFRMPQRGVRLQPIRSFFNWLAGFFAQQEMEQRAKDILLEFIGICGTTEDIRIVKRHGEDIRAFKGGSKDRNHFESHPIDQTDFSALIVFFGLDIDPTNTRTINLRVDSIGTDVDITPDYKQTDTDTTLTLHLTPPASSAAQSN